jgi:lipoprotein-anchoring transpeptidase ErfK/SrfK
VIAALPPEDQPEHSLAKELPPQLRRQLVDYVTSESAGTIIIDTPHTFLYLVRGHAKALRYGIGVGREVGGQRAHQPHERVAGLASAKRDDRAPALSAAVHGRRRK